MKNQVTQGKNAATSPVESVENLNPVAQMTPTPFALTPMHAATQQKQLQVLSTRTINSFL